MNAIINRFVDRKAPNDVRREQYIRLTGITGIIVNLLLAFSKMAAGAFIGSVAILGDGINNLSDTGGALVSLVSSKISAKPADSEHPFGHERFEYLASSAVALLVLYVSVQLFLSAIEHIRNPEILQLSLPGGIVLILSILAKLWLYIFYRKIAKRIDSQLVMANAVDSISDVIATSVILVTSLLSPILSLPLDGPLGILVSLVIAKSGWEIMSNTMDKLLGAKPDAGKAREVLKKIKSYPGVLGAHDMTIHEYGPLKQFIIVHVEVDAAVDVMQSHELIDRIEIEIGEAFDVDLTIHMDPVLTNDPRISKAHAMVTKRLTDLPFDWSVHDFRIVNSYPRNKCVFDILVPVEERLSDAAIEKNVRSRIAGMDIYDYVINIDRDYIDELEENNAESADHS